MNNNIDNFHKLTICSFDVRLMQSANYKKKIDELMNFIQSSNIDIICLQGIHNTRLLKFIIKKILLLNIDQHNPFFHTFPTIDTSQLYQDTDNTLNNRNDVLKITWSKSNDQDLSNIDCLIISKFRIISCGKEEMKWDNITENRFVYVTNINFNGILLSIYNAGFLNDFIGISNSPIRRCQIKQLKKIINANTENIKRDKHIYKMAINENINIITCLANITEILNNDINPEYLHFIRTLKCIDVYRYVQTIKQKYSNNKKDATTLCGLRMNYVLLYCDDDNLNENLDNTSGNIACKIENIVYKNNKLIIVNSTINKMLVYYDDYPIISSFLIEKQLSVRKDDESSSGDEEDIAIEIDD